MNQQVFYIHGGRSYTKHEDYIEDLRTNPLRSASDKAGKQMWPDILRNELGEGYKVFVPSMPNKQNAKYEEWKIWFERHFEFINDDVILVGWSLGGAFLAKYLSENTPPFKIKALITLAAPFDYFVSEGSREDEKYFTRRLM